jgi:hypothetical protein
VPKRRRHPMYQASLVKIESFGWVDYVIEELDKLDSYEDTREYVVAEHEAKTPEEAIEALFAEIGEKVGIFGEWIEKGFFHETKAPQGTYTKPSTRYALFVLADDITWWLIDHDSPELFAEVGRRLGV